MKLGVHIGYWGLGLTREDQLAIVQEAERLGYDSVWTAEAYGSDAATILGWIAGLTEKIKIGSPPLPTPPPPPPPPRPRAPPPQWRGCPPRRSPSPPRGGCWWASARAARR